MPSFRQLIGLLFLFAGTAVQAQANCKVATDLGEYTAGVIFTTLVPSPWREGLPIVVEYQQMYSAATGKSEFSYLGLEVYINAKVLVEGLRLAGRNITRESLVTGLESMTPRHFGPMTIGFAPGRHNGSSYVGLTMINRQGRFIE